jgi:glycosyltransferase involved in cell wall biosynthesis
LKVLYIASGRTVSEKNQGRKIEAILSCWRKSGHEVVTIFGGEFEGGIGISGGAEKKITTQKWYRKLKVLAPLFNTISEWRDIAHDKFILGQINKIFESFKPDLVWERSFRLHAAGIEFSTLHSIPYVLEWKDNLINYNFSFFRNRALRLESKKISSADQVVVESHVLKKMMEENGLELNKIIVAHNAVDAQEFEKNLECRKRVRDYFAIDDNTTFIGYLGSYTFYHDALRLVLAAKKLQENRSNIKIIMVGSGGNFLECLRLAKKSGVLDKSLIMTGLVPKTEVSSILSALDIAVLPGSTNIICPIKVQEYMAAGLPTIAPDYECNREIIQDGITGSFFTPGDEDSLAEKILEISQSPDLQIKMGELARAEVLNKYSWEATWGAALEKITDKRKFNE